MEKEEKSNYRNKRMSIYVLTYIHIQYEKPEHLSNTSATATLCDIYILLSIIRTNLKVHFRIGVSPNVQMLGRLWSSFIWVAAATAMQLLYDKQVLSDE